MHIRAGHRGAPLIQTSRGKSVVPHGYITRRSMRGVRHLDRHFLLRRFSWTSWCCSRRPQENIPPGRHRKGVVNTARGAKNAIVDAGGCCGEQGPWINQEPTHLPAMRATSEPTGQNQQRRHLQPGVSDANGAPLFPAGSCILRYRHQHAKKSTYLMRY